MTAAVDLVVRNTSDVLTMGGGSGPATGGALSDIGRIERGAIVVREGHVEWVGPESELDHVLGGRSVTRELDAGGNAVLPAFVDPHTHVPFAGGRQAEFEMRVSGKSYLDIAAAGAASSRASGIFARCPWRRSWPSIGLASRRWRAPGRSRSSARRATASPSRTS